ncbi:hypothetical protein SAMN05428988_3183 [Chitinophaga sp. YR573]|uniref:hypothetical protein n=1 Tax=Chitinophaga sp. YR573 TaxID=1881040 RepID=UPI0008C958F7|nr:hypothetical protein [Chitinophaga sp. YR573]SEW21194.1 hypothetical protein SAMN05428988_3183 [Chitinophaga sp. YR573]
METEGPQDTDRIVGEFAWFLSRLKSLGYSIEMISIIMKGFPEIFANDNYATSSGRDVGIMSRQVDLEIPGSTHGRIVIIPPDAINQNDLPGNI